MYTQHPIKIFSLFVVFSLLFFIPGCATTNASKENSTASKPLDTLYIKAKKNPSGEFEFKSYNARSLFVEALEHAKQLRCDAAVKLYDQLVEEFPESRFVSASLYNAGLCLQESQNLTAAAIRFEKLLSISTDATDTKHALFQLCEIAHDLELTEKLFQCATKLDQRQDLTEEEKIETQTRKAQALLLQKKWQEAEEVGKNTLRVGKRLNKNHQVTDVFFLAASNFVVAKSIHNRANEILIPSADVNTQHAILEERAQLILKAQNAYFDTIRFKEAHWAAAAGYQIGKMYDALWDDIIHAPVPPSEKSLSTEDLDFYQKQYRQKLAKLVEPLIHHAVRYWELTLNMIKRTQVQTHWTEKIEADLNQIKKRLAMNKDKKTQQ